MRVVAGSFKGHRLRSPRRTTRPTLDRVREALFSMLGPLDGLSALDLYAGSGALGIEALSRGAASTVFVDSDAAAVRAIRENLERTRFSRIARTAAASESTNAVPAAPRESASIPSA